MNTLGTIKVFLVSLAFEHRVLQIMIDRQTDRQTDRQIDTDVDQDRDDTTDNDSLEFSQRRLRVLLQRRKLRRRSTGK